MCLLALPLALLASLIIPHAGTWPREASRLTTALQTRVCREALPAMKASADQIICEIYGEPAVATTEQ